jgi:hypothetical protein
VIDNTTKSNNLTDQMYWYKADMRSDFKIGGKEFWQISAPESDSEDDGEEMYNAELLNKVKRGPTINVLKKVNY